jgi:hypothetical protein
MNKKHRILFFLVTLSGIFVLSSIGCSTPQERAAEADAKFKEERLKILERYQECVKQNLEDKEKLSSCEHYLKAVDAMK